MNQTFVADMHINIFKHAYTVKFGVSKILYKKKNSARVHYIDQKKILLYCYKTSVFLIHQEFCDCYI